MLRHVYWHLDGGIKLPAGAEWELERLNPRAKFSDDKAE